MRRARDPSTPSPVNAVLPRSLALQIVARDDDDEGPRDGLDTHTEAACDIAGPVRHRIEVGHGAQVLLLLRRQSVESHEEEVAVDRVGARAGS